MFVCHKDHSNSTVDNGLEKNTTEGGIADKQEKHNQRKRTQEQLARDANIKTKAET